MEVKDTAVLYGRYSSDRQKDTSIEDQFRDCMRYAEQHDLRIVGTYADRATTGRNDSRAEFQRMLADSDKGLFKYVIVWKFDRFARNRYDSAVNKARLKRNGVKVLSAMEQISDSPEGVLLESLLEGMAEYYSADLREKTSRGMMSNALKCKHTGGRPLLGYKINPDLTYSIDEATAPTVRLIFELYAADHSYREIIAELSKRGMKTAAGKPFGTNSLHDLLVNERYTGVYIYGKTARRDDGSRNNHELRAHDSVVRIEGGMPAIIEKDLWNTVREKMLVNKRAPARKKAVMNYLLSHKIFCGECGGAMVGMSAHGKYSYYECSTKKRQHTCKKSPVRKEQIEDLVLRQTLTLLTPENIDYIAEQTAALSEKECADSAETTALEIRLREAETTLQNVANAIAQGIITPTTKELLARAEAEHESIKAQLEESRRARGVPVTKEQVIFWLEQFQNMDITDEEACRALIDSLVNAVYVYDDGKVLITYNSSGKQSVAKLKNCSDFVCEGSPAPETDKPQ